ncbi:hypothetical protein FQN50_002615 [Emmonsiellopsis sp. PD_5]|nr:hypothetical protein FQN50_002615 [Emmonsiellopsis sp. PD_5]
MENQSSWTCNANDAVQISIVQPGADKLEKISTFQPEFTYPIFGEEETIFGYQDLSIRLRFAAHNLRSNAQISYDKKFKTVADVAPVDLLKTLRPWLPEESFATLQEFEGSVLKDESAKDFKPPGSLIHSYTNKGRNYEIWAGSLVDPDVRAILDRIQIFVSFFVEGGTPITTDDFEWTLQRWTVYFVYEKIEPPTPTASSYSFVGYATTYRWYFYLQDGTKQPQTSNGPFPYAHEVSVSEIPGRLRISQFLILQPHQQSGHGSQLYRTIQSACIKDPTLHELTVEDPNESFDYLRDKNDYQTLAPQFAAQNITINANPYTPDQTRRRPRLMPTGKLIPAQSLRALRAQFKIAPVQFAHIVEMYLLSQIPTDHRGANTNTMRILMQKFRAPNEHDRRYYWWRMLVKQRLYKHHRDLLIQLDREDRYQKLDETLQNVEEGYAKLLEAFEGKAEAEEEEEGEGEESGVEVGAETGPSKERGKRKFTVLEDEDEEDGEGVAAGNGNGNANGEDSASKKMKT